MSFFRVQAASRRPCATADARAISWFYICAYTACAELQAACCHESRTRPSPSRQQQIVGRRGDEYVNYQRVGMTVTRL
eukprot:scaffold23658_cov19-Prasinocladus_malaysianus.AAC.1